METHEENRSIKVPRRASIGLRALVVFFFFGAAMCLLTIAGLLFPGGFLEPMWRLNPDAQAAFRSLDRWSILLMLIVGAACASTAIGLAKRAGWGRRLAIAVLAVNLLGDTLNAIVRHDPRTLIGLPIGGALIFYLTSKRVRGLFDGHPGKLG